ncbi:MAG: hypothetical protein V3U87_01630, partial [Methylococcaceae bacterium]
ISSNPVITLELTSLKKIDEDSTIVIQEIYNLNLKNNDICRKGDQIRVKGLNLDKLESPDLMLASISIARIAKYIKKEEETLYFECQETEHYGDIDIFLKSDTVVSRATVLTSLAVSTPVITDVSYNSTTNKITVTGFNLNKQLTINLGDVNVKLDQKNGDPETFLFTADALMKSGELKIIADGAHSNSIWVKINKTIKGKIKFVSNRVDSTHLVVGVNEDDNHPSVSGDFTIARYRGKPTLIPAFIHTPDQTERPEYVLHLSAIALPEDDFVEVSPISTAIALIWIGMGVELNISPKDYVLFREQIAELPEIILFADLLTQALITNPYVMQEKFKTGTLYNANYAALTAAYGLINQYQIDKVNEKKNDLLTKKSDSKKARVFPEEFDDIQVYESKNDVGNITIENSTQLFLAIEIKDSEGNILQAYPKNSFSPLVAVPQSNWFGFASKKLFKQPQEKHSIVRVLTSGVDNYLEYHSIGTVDRIRTGLMIRTFIERIFFPLFSVLDIPEKEISKIIILSQSPIYSAVGNALTGENIEIIDISGAIINGLVDDLLGPGGPIVEGLTRKYGGSFISKAIGKKLAMLLTPGVAPVDILFKTIKAIPAVVAISDVVSTDAQIDFNVQFTPTIEYVVPNQLQEHELKDDISILGSGYGAVIDEVNDEKVYPEIYFRDQEGTIKIVEVKQE